MSVCVILNSLYITNVFDLSIYLFQASQVQVILFCGTLMYRSQYCNSVYTYLM